jgi:pimeloyl-ACP methyl ester carboxylesterase
MVTALVLVSAIPSGYSFTGEMPPTLQAFVAAYQQHDLAQAAELATQIWFDGPQRRPEQMNPALRARVQAMMRDVVAAGAIDLTGEKFASRPAIDRLAEIQVPTLVIVGDQDDPSVLRAAEELGATIPGAERAVISGGAHLLNLEKPEEFNRLVFDFLLRWQKK